MTQHADSKTIAFFVAPDGNDHWTGALPDAKADGSDGPFATLQRARDAIRASKAAGGPRRAVTVAVRGGVFRLTEPLVLTPEDSGTAESPVTYSAYRDEQPVISGGRRLEGWRPETNGLWSVDASAVVAADSACRQLFLDGRRVKRTRRPREGYYSVAGIVPDVGNPLAFACRRGDLRSEWADGHTELVILQNWFEIRQPLVAVDSDGSLARLSGISSANREVNPRYWVENVADGLDEPGAWHFDWRTKQIIYRPLPGEEPAGIETVVPILDSLLRLDGGTEGGRPVEHVIFSGFAFCHTTWTLPPKGYNDRQAAHDIPAAFQATGARACRIEHCRFARLGGYAVEWTTGCRDNRVTDCEMTDLGAGGVKIGGPNVYENQEDSHLSRNNTVERCHIHDIGLVYPAAVGVWIGQSCGNTIARNHIHDTYYTGISAGWTWGYGVSNARDNLLAHNHIHHIGRGLLSDMAGIYLLGTQPGTVIRNNVIHDISSFVRGYGGWGVYLDEGCMHVLVENNLVYRTQSGGLHQHYGRENLIRNNIFAFSREGQILRTLQEKHKSFTLERNIIYCDREFPLSGNWSNGFQLDHNLYFRLDGLTGKSFYAPLVYLGLRPFPNGFLRERAHYDVVGMSANTSGKMELHPELRWLGVAPLLGAPAYPFPAEDDWARALVLPNLVKDSGQEAPLGETETRLLRGEHDLYVSVLCRHSRLADKDTGMSNDTKQESVEVFLKPDLTRDPCAQFCLKPDGTAIAHYYPGDAWSPISWEGRAARAAGGWRALFRIPLEGLSAGNADGLWQIFVGRYALLPPIAFRAWQETGQDGHSLVADPLFRDPERGDFRLREDSPALSLGFKPFEELLGK